MNALAQAGSVSSSLGSLISTQPRCSSPFSSSSRRSAIAMTRSFFIFTMAISVIHNPFDNKLCCLLKIFAGGFPQSSTFGFCGTSDLRGSLGSSLLCLL